VFSFLVVVAVVFVAVVVGVVVVGMFVRITSARTLQHRREKIPPLRGDLQMSIASQVPNY
jgi:hypothetical protein